MATSTVRQFLSTEGMAKALGISTRTLLDLRKQKASPFHLGKHYRFRGASRKAPLQWFPEETDQAFTQHQVDRWNSIETMDGD